MTRSTRNLEELMKTQVVSDSDDTVNRALKMSGELQNLRKENEALKSEKKALESEREHYADRIKSLERELRKPRASDNGQEKKLLDDLKCMQKGFGALYDELADIKSERDELQIKLERAKVALASAEVAVANSVPHALPSDAQSPTQEELRLAEQVRSLKVSCDSLFADLDKVKKERDELKAKVDANAATNETLKRPSAPAPSRSSMLSWMTSSLTNNNNTEINNDNNSDQASFIMKAVERHGPIVSATSSNSLERKLQELEVENLKLKSTIVHLQSQYKEERYKNQQLQQIGFEVGLSPRSAAASSIIRKPIRFMSLQVPLRSSALDRTIDSDDDDNDDISVSDTPSLLADEGRSIRKNESLRKLPSPRRSASLRRIHECKAKKDPVKLESVVTKATTGENDNSVAAPSAIAKCDEDNDNTTAAADTTTAGALAAATTEEPSAPPLTASSRTFSTPNSTLGTMDRRPQNIQPTLSFNRKLQPTSSFDSKSSSSISDAIASSNKIPLKRNNSNKLTWGRSPARDMQHQETQRVLSSHPAYRKVDRNHSGGTITTMTMDSSDRGGPKRTPSLIGMIWGSSGAD
ncbi:hypothetical protein IV203_019384 [Nitzschia inconspicua]|uniref:Uncharacterized protein n=1 Tax=Nitzschia inconspicua TaxID=303405 RepID=A0A9K3Q747_9STRA|nr:hypothetical protein IV203_019384 [Nitzschia inconspicua]